MRIRISSVLVLVVAVALTLALSAGSPAASSGKTRVAVVFAYGGLGDKAFNDSTYSGLQRAKKDLGIEFDYVEPKEHAEYEGFIRSYAKTGDYDLIVCVGFSQGTTLEKVAKDFPKQKFMILDAVVDLPNVASYVYKSEEAAYLAGAYSAMLTKETSIPGINSAKKLGFVGGMDIPLIQAFAAGFKAGAQKVDAATEVIVSYVGSWNDPAKAKELALAAYYKGADIVYQVASMGGLGVINAAREYGAYAIGQDANQNHLAPQNMVLSVLKRLDNSVYMAIRDVQQGKFTGGVHNLGLKEGGVGITTEDSAVKVPQRILDRVKEIEQEIIDGKIQVPSTL